MQSIEFAPLLTTPGAVKDPLVILVGEVPFEDMKAAYLKHTDDDRDIVLVDLTKNPSPNKVAWYLDTSRDKQIYYINKRIESAPALFHHLDKLEAGRILEDRVQHVYLARYPQPNRLQSGKIDYYRTLLMRRFGYSQEMLDAIIDETPTRSMALDNLKYTFNREMSKIQRPDLHLEAPELEHVRETYDPPSIFKG